MENVAPLLKGKEKQTQKVTLVHPSLKLQTYKLNTNTYEELFIQV